MTEWIEAGRVPGLLRPGMTVFVQGGVTEPLTTLAAIAAEPAASRGVTYTGVTIPGVNRTDWAGFHVEARSRIFFAIPEVRESLAAGRAEFIPIQYRNLFDHLAHEVTVDLALVQVGPPDGDGNCPLGPSVDFVPAVLGHANRVVAEVNRALPDLAGAPRLPLNRFDYAIDCDRAPIAVPPEVPSGGAREIGAHVAGLVGDGDCIQIGIGKVPDAVLAGLRAKNDLGFHAGMITDAVVELARAGVMTGAAKNIDSGRLVTGIAIGSDRLYGELAELPNVDFRGADYTHDVRVIAQLDNFVSINSVIEIDLMGQVNAEMVGGTQVSGPGGSVDFMRGAALSKGGRSILALNATAARGTLSRIVPRLAEGTAATALRTDVDYVVTEFGVARLKNRTLADRAAALIEVAAPAFRDELRAASRGL